MAESKRDYYDVLGVERGASDAEIKKAFRQLARTIHPDVSSDADAHERFREAAEAYEVLSSPDSRARYDRFGHRGLGDFEFHTEQFMDLGNLGDLLGALFGGAAFAPGGVVPGPDAELRVEIELEDAARGREIELETELVQPCDHCGASGAEPPTQPERCESCGGAGQVRRVAQSAFGQLVRTGPCPACRGRGVIVEHPCVECRGRGRRPAKRTLSVAIPAGIEDGQSIRITGAGHAGEAGSRSGDLYVHVRVRPDRRFRREGRDLVSTVELTAAEAILGATKSVPTLDGDVELRFEPGTQPGETRVLQGKGMPPLRGRGRGDQHVLVQVRVPRNLSVEQRTLVEQLQASEGEGNYREPEPQHGWRDALRRAFS